MPEPYPSNKPWPFGDAAPTAASIAASIAASHRRPVDLDQLERAERAMREEAPGTPMFSGVDRELFYGGGDEHLADSRFDALPLREIQSGSVDDDFGAADLAPGSEAFVATMVAALVAVLVLSAWLLLL